MYGSYLLRILTILCVITSCQAQENAGLSEIQSLKGKLYSSDSLPALLKKYQFTESSQVSPIDDPEQFTVFVYRLQNDYLVLFTLRETDGKEWIQDVLSITGVKQTEQVKTVLCWEGAVNNVELIALINPGREQHSKAIRAWRFNRDKRKFEVHAAENVSCLNEGYAG